jgi:NAD(P)-dependent dehydrogenase (short-subunit alcohol dehydrogenase family)
VGGQFEGKVTIVTGAASGICRVILSSFVREGASGVIADVNEGWGQQVAEGLRAEGGRVMFVRTDVTDSASVERLLDETVKAYGGVDVLVNCAGVGVHKTVVETTDEEWDFQVDTQLRAVFLTCRAAGRRMISQGRGGRIVNIGSTAGAVARVRAAPHCASKAGVVQFTKVLALELGPYGITANVVAPGLTDIRKISKANPTDEYRERFIREVPLGRLADPQEIADTVLFMASDQARFITGQAIYVDGGYSAGKLSIDGPHRTVHTPTVSGHRSP